MRLATTAPAPSAAASRCAHAGREEERRRCRHRAWTRVAPRVPAPLVPSTMTPESARGGEGDESVRLAHPRSRVAAAASASSRGGGTPGSWNLGVAHSAANKKDQRDYVDALFAQYPHLMEAAEADDRKKVQELMDAVYLPAPDASTAKIRDAQLRAAALAAARAGGAKSLRLLLDRGADLGLFDEVVGSDPEERLRCTMGIECAGRGRAEVLDVLLSEDVGVSTECRDPRNGMTALMAAARFGHAACIAVLVDRGADVDARSEYGSGAMGGGSTAAMMAAENGHAGALNALRAAGADVNLTREVDGKTAMQLHREKVTAEMKKLSNMGYVQGSSIGNYATEI